MTRADVGPTDPTAVAKAWNVPAGGSSDDNSCPEARVDWTRWRAR
jgi:hypothetical protein